MQETLVRFLGRYPGEGVDYPPQYLWASLVAQGASLVAQTVKASARNAGDLGSIPGTGTFPGDVNDNTLQFSCLGNSMDGGTMGSQRVGHD